MKTRRSKYRSLKEEFFSTKKNSIKIKQLNECGCGMTEPPEDMNDEECRAPQMLAPDSSVVVTIGDVESNDDTVNSIKIGRVGAPGGPNLPQPHDAVKSHDDQLLFDKEETLEQYGEASQPTSTGGPSKEGSVMLMDEDMFPKELVHFRITPDGGFMTMEELAPDQEEALYKAVKAVVNFPRSSIRKNEHLPAVERIRWEKSADGIHGEAYVGVSNMPDEGLDEAALKGHQSVDMARWELENKKEEDKPNKPWKDFGKHDDLKEAHEKFSGGGPEFESDPYSELEFPNEDEIDDPEYQEYLGRLHQMRDNEEAAQRLGDIDGFIDPDELPW